MSWSERFAEICQLTHSEQAKYWLNGFWEDGAEKHADDIWDLAHLFIEVEQGEPKRYGSRMKEIQEGCDLDELKSHVLLERMGETLTIIDLRKRLSLLDIDNNKRMALIEYLLEKSKKTPQQLVDAPQPLVDPAKLQAAEDAFTAAGEALDVAAQEKEAAKAAAAEAARMLKAAEAAAEEAAQALAAAEKAKETAADAHAKQEAATAEVKKAEAELQASVDALSSLEKAKADKIASLQAIIDDPNQGNVKKGKAVQEKATLEAEDDLPLRKAKITQGAALKRMNKVAAVAEAATAEAANLVRKADAAKAASAKAKSAADEAEAVSRQAKADADRKDAEAVMAHAAAQEAVKEAQAQLEEIRNSSGPPYGPIYWMERTLKEKQKFMK